MKGRFLILTILGMMVSMACTFNTLLPATSVPTAEPLPSPTRPQSVFIDGRSQGAAVETPDAVVQPAQSQSQSQSAQPVQSQSVQAQSGGYNPSGGSTTTYYIPPGCTPRYDWGYSYVVQRGDTLSSIAWRASTTVQALAQGNCIANPNYIYAGQYLRVPYPVAANPPPQYPPPHYPPPGNWQSVGQVIPSPFLSLYGNQYQLQGGTVVTLSWAINTYGVSRVEFYFTPNGMSPQLVGTDTYFGDGVAVAWGVPPGSAGVLSANGYYGSGLVKTVAAYSYVYTSGSPTALPPTPAPPVPPVVVGSGLSVSPVDSANNNTLILPPDQLITISWPATFPAETIRVEFELIPAGMGTGSAIGVDLNPADGVSIIWNAVNGIQGTLRAVAYFQGGYAPQYSDSYYIIAGMP